MEIDLKQIPSNPFPSVPDTRPDAITASCIEDANLQTANLLNETLRDNNIARKRYGNRAYWLVVGWLFAIFIILIFQGFLGNGAEEWSLTIVGIKSTVKKSPIFFLSDSVLIALIGGTTASVLGLLAFVMKYLFPSSAAKFDKSN